MRILAKTGQKTGTLLFRSSKNKHVKQIKWKIKTVAKRLHTGIKVGFLMCFRGIFLG